MKEHLLQESFTKAKRDSGKDSKHGCCVFLAEEITDKYKYQISYKTFEHLYDAVILKTREMPNLKTDLLDKLALYMGNEDYSDYVSKQSKPPKQTAGGIRQKRLDYTAYVLIGLIVFLLIGYPIYERMVESKCMVWIENHYEKAECNGKNTVAFDKKAYKKLKQIQVDQETTFFDNNGNPLVWYVKSNGDVTFFSYYGIDPETGKTLKPITDYMIAKHVK